MVPTRTAGSFVYLDGVDSGSVDVARLADAGSVAAEALRHGHAGKPQPPGGGARGLRREELITLLGLHE